jgi:osmotically inducible protein OsmC
MHAESSATTSWSGTLARGSGQTSLASGAAGPLEVSWARRTERTADTTSPEELIAAAHASCYAMAFSHELAEAGATPEHLDVSATVTFEIVDGAPTISRSALTVRGAASGIDAEGFARVAAAAKDGCPVSRALAGNVEITLDAALA